jgi:2-polyprenyl-3-methyl-5-hydroxy-6-metoxy-1,4-benzoquinol methylase
MRRRTGDTVQIDGAYQHRALHHGPAAQRFWHYAKQRTIGDLLPPARGDLVLDVGCGSGTISSFLGTLGARVVGLDGNPEAIRFAEQKYGTENVRFECRLVDEQYDLVEEIDKVYCLELIEHIYLEQGRELLSALHRTLRPDGAVLLTTPNYRSAWPIQEWLLDRGGFTPRLKDHQHVEHFHLPKVRALAQDAGFVVARANTFCLLAPWVAPISWSLAEKLHGWELKSPFPLGSLLACVLRKPQPAPPSRSERASRSRRASLAHSATELRGLTCGRSNKIGTGT